VLAALARGDSVDPAQYYFRTAPRFETSAPKYAYLNRLLAISSGDRRASGPIYTVEEILCDNSWTFSAEMCSRRWLLHRRRATSGVVACANEVSVGDRFPSAKAGHTAMNSRLLMTVRIAAAPSQKLGTVPHAIAPSCRLRVAILKACDFAARFSPGEADWLLLRSDNVLELDLRITLETDDHALIYMTFQGLRHGSPEVIAALGVERSSIARATTFARSHDSKPPRKSYAFLNRMVTVGVGEARPAGAIHRIYEIL